MLIRDSGLSGFPVWSVRQVSPEPKKDKSQQPIDPVNALQRDAMSLKGWDASKLRRDSEEEFVVKEILNLLWHGSV